MKKSLLLAATLLLSAVSFGQIKLQNENQDIELPKPTFDRYSKSMIETLRDRHSVRDFEHKELSIEDLSTLCWAACGRSRDENHITSPTAMNRQEIRLYVFLQKGVYEYIPGNNVLHFICQGDYREMFVSNSPVAESSKADKKGKGGKNGKGGDAGKTFGQPFVMEAPVTLLMVIDLDKFGSTDERAKTLAYMDAGIVSENINLYCESVKLGTVTRATMDVQGLKKLLNLNNNQIPALNNPVGYPK